MVNNSIKRAVRKAADGVRLLKAVWSDYRTPWYARLVVGLTLAYAVSPIDLIPDFLPVVGYLDDLLIVPVGLWLAARLVPQAVWEEHRIAVGRRRDEIG